MAADDAITYLPCRGQQDVPALRAFFDELLPAPYPESFYREAAGRCALPAAAQAAMAAGGHAGMWWYSVHLAAHRGRLVGAVSRRLAPTPSRCAPRVPLRWR